MCYYDPTSSVTALPPSKLNLPPTADIPTAITRFTPYYVTDYAPDNTRVFILVGDSTKSGIYSYSWTSTPDGTAISPLLRGDVLT